MSTSKLFEKELKKTTNINLHVVDLGGGHKTKKHVFSHVWPFLSMQVYCNTSLTSEREIIGIQGHCQRKNIK